MKCLSVPILALIAAGASAQAPTDLLETTIWQAYGKLQTESNFNLSLTGTETSFGITRKFTSNLYFATSIDSRSGQQTGAKVELDDYDTSGSVAVLVHRYVGDGGTLWSYDLSNQRFSSTFYSYYGKNQPPNYLGSDAPRLLAQLYSVAKGPSAYMVRMLREINPGVTLTPSRYDTWAPGERTGQPTLGNPVLDPISALAYTIDVPPESIPGRQVLLSTGQWVLYGPGSTNPNRSVAFQIDDRNGGVGTPDLHLDDVYFSSKTPTTVTAWTLAITDPATAVPGGAFVPYRQNVTQGWLPLSSPRPYSG